MSNEEKKPKALSKEDIQEILDIFVKAKEKASGKKIETAILFDEEDSEILIDNRDKEKLN